MTTQEILDKINGLLDKVQTRMDELTAKVNSVLSHVPFYLDWVVDKLMSAWNTMLDKMSEFWDWFTDKLAYCGDPFGLGEVGKSWINDLGLPTKALADSINEEHELIVDQNWTGTAATAYTSQVPAQEDALRTVGASFASAVDSAMGSMKTGLIGFWIGIGVGITSLVFAIIAATAATGSVIGIPAAPFAVIAGVVAFLLTAGAGLAALMLSCDSTADALRNARTFATEWPDFAVA